MSIYIHESFREKLQNQRLLYPSQALCAIKNSQLKIVATNDRTAQLLGFKDAKGLIDGDIMDNSLACEAKSLSAQFQHEDAFAEKHDSVTTLTWARYADKQNHLLLTEKSKLLNEQNETIGYFIYSVDLSQHALVNLQCHLDLADILSKNKRQFSKIIYPGFPEVKLSDRQSICLYYVINGYSSSTIGLKLGLSKRTIESYIDHLKDKFHCDSKQELIEMAISRGYLEIIPKSLLGF